MEAFSMDCEWQQRSFSLDQLELQKPRIATDVCAASRTTASQSVFAAHSNIPLSKQTSDNALFASPAEGNAGDALSTDGDLSIDRSCSAASQQSFVLDFADNEPEPEMAAMPPPVEFEGLAGMIAAGKQEEEQTYPNPQYLLNHGADVIPGEYLTEKQRYITTCWMVEVAQYFGLCQDTLFLAVALFDRFLSCTHGLKRSHLQLASVACMFLASKYEENPHPAASLFTRLLAEQFTQADLLRMEQLVWSSVGMRIHSPTTYTFLRLLKIGQIGGQLSQQTLSLATYFIELAMLQYALLVYRPSAVAASALILAMAYNGEESQIPWTLELIGYSKDLLQECLADIMQVHSLSWKVQDPSDNLFPIRQKYDDAQSWQQVSTTFTPASELPACLRC